MNVAVIGTGYVGLVSGACFAEFGIQVTCVDQDEERVAMLSRGEVPFFEPGLEELVRRHSETGRLTFTTDTAAAIQRSLVLFIAVGTPSQPDGSSDLSAVEQVAREVAASINGYKVVVTKSTTVFLFAMIIGMSCGLGQYVVAGLGAGFAGLTLTWLKVSSRWESDDTLSAPGDLKDFLDDDLPDDGAAK